MHSRAPQVRIALKPRWPLQAICEETLTTAALSLRRNRRKLISTVPPANCARLPTLTSARQSTAKCAPPLTAPSKAAVHFAIAPMAVAMRRHARVRGAAELAVLVTT